MGVSSIPSNGIFMSFLTDFRSIGFDIDATFQSLFPTIGGITTIHFKPSREITFYTDGEKANTCYYSVDRYEDDNNRCNELIEFYGREFLTKCVAIDMKAMDATIVGKRGERDVYAVTEGRSNDGYCMGIDNNGRLDCTFRRMENEISFHRNGQVDIFNDNQEHIRCSYIINTDVKVTCPEPTERLRCLVDSLAGNARFTSDGDRPLELKVEVGDDFCWTPDTQVYKQIPWEKAFFDSNLERVRNEITLDATFAADNDGQTISTVAMKRNGEIELAGQKKICKCEYRANFNSERGTISIGLLKADSRECQSLLSGSTKAKGKRLSFTSMLKPSKKSRSNSFIVIANKAMKRLEVHMENERIELLGAVEGGKAYIK